MKKFAFFITLISLFLSIFFLFKIIKNKSKQISLNEEKSIDLQTVAEKLIVSNEPTTEQLNQIEKIDISFWIPYWDLDKSLYSFKQNSSKISAISPSWYYVKSEDHLFSKTSVQNKEILKLAKERKVKIIPSISNTSHEELSQIFNDEQKSNNLILDIAKEVNNNDFDGIDLDFENIYTSDSHNFEKFVEKLNNKLKETNKILTVTVLWKTELLNLTNVSETRNAQNWKNLSKKCDYIRIMAYEFTSSKMKAGPIAPYDFTEEIIKYAVKEIDIEKIVLGLPLYAYSWIENTPGAKALVYSDIEKIKNSKKIVSDEFVDKLFEKQLIYIENNTKNIIWYQDQDTVAKRFELAKSYGINKVIFWRLGGEDQKIYNLV